MASKGKLTTSKNQKAHYAAYKTENRVQKNKIKKLEVHCKTYTKDEKAAQRLKELVSKGGYKPRAKPLDPGSNPTISKKMDKRTVEHPKTPGEQLAYLLGISLKRPRYNKQGKASVTYKKKRKNVRA